MEKIQYPQYRKYLNGKSYFKIVSPDEVEELQMIGDKFIFHIIKAKILPDRNFIYDITFDYKTNWVEITEEEYNRKKETLKII